MMSKLILIIPVYNGANLLADTFVILDEALESKKYLDKIYFINDGSVDDTGDLITDYQAGHSSQIILISNATNIGKGASIKKAVAKLRDYQGVVAFTDIDLPYGLDIFDQFLDIIINDEADLVIGDRDINGQPPQYSRYRLIFKKIFVFMLPTKLRKYHDTQSGAKAFNKKITNNFDKVISDQWCFDVELLLLAEENDFKVKTQLVQLRAKPTNGGVSFLKHGFNVVLDLVKIRLRNKAGYYKI